MSNAEPTPGLTVRLAIDSDLEPILQLLEQLKLEPSPVTRGAAPAALEHAVWPVILNQSGRSVLVAETDRLVGTAELLIVPNLSYGGAPWAAVENVVVDALPRTGDWRSADGRSHSACA